MSFSKQSEGMTLVVFTCWVVSSDCSRYCAKVCGKHIWNTRKTHMSIGIATEKR